MTPAEALSQIETELREATPGPWEVGVTYNYDRNATLIAHAPTYLAALVRVVRAVQAVECLHCPEPSHGRGHKRADPSIYDSLCPSAVCIVKGEIRTALDALTEAVEG